MNRQVISCLAILSFLLLLCASVLAQSSGSARAYNRRALTRYVRGDMDGAIADFDLALEFDPSYADAYFNRGNARYKKGDLDGAIADLEMAIALNPRYAAAYNNRGNARQAKGETEAAIADYSQAIALEPRLAEAYKIAAPAGRPKAILREPLQITAWRSR